MREIKFRAWNPDEKIMGHVLSIDFQNDEVFVRESGYNGTFHRELSLSRCPIMQFTGLKDKNGKEIYEGDILRFPQYEGEKEIEPAVATVFYRAPKFLCNGVFPGAAKLLGFDPSEVVTADIPTYKVDIIGNIHENPELVK